MKKLNCWEFKNCGRQLGGGFVFGLGICPATLEKRLDGVHGGINAGRTCWVIAGTMCESEVQGTFANKYRDCEICDFYRKIRREEFHRFQRPAELLGKLNDPQ